MQNGFEKLKTSEIMWQRQILQFSRFCRVLVSRMCGDGRPELHQDRADFVGDGQSFNRVGISLRIESGRCHRIVIV